MILLRRKEFYDLHPRARRHSPQAYCPRSNMGSIVRLVLCLRATIYSEGDSKSGSHHAQARDRRLPEAIGEQARKL